MSKTIGDKTAAGGAPVNMMDWQAQQKAMKEADRQSKNQSAQNLHNFKATTLEQSALTGIKQEDREKQRLAQEQLHNYRATFVGGGKKGGAAEKQVGDVDGGSTEDDVTSGINVLDAAASFGKSPEAAPELFGGGTFSMPSQETPTVEPASNPPPPPVEEPVMVEKPEDSSGEEWISVPPQAQPTEDEWGQMTMKHTNFDASAVDVDAAPTTVDIDFSFVLVTLAEQPDVTKYLRAAAFIVGDDSVVGPAQIKSMQPQSADRPGVYKNLVTASLPIGLKHGHASEESRQHVLGLLKTAVRDGSLFTVASTA
jgi:hypothetical protein